MPEQQKSAATLAAETKAAFDSKIDAVKALAEEALGKAASGEALSNSLKEKADEALTGMNEVKGQLTDIEQRIARGGPESDGSERSLGERFVEGDAFKAFQASGFSKTARNADLQVKAVLTTSTADAAGSVGGGVVPTHRPGIVEQPQQRLYMRDLIMPGRMDTGALEYVREVAFNNNAAETAENSPKPMSDIQLENVTASAKVIPHHVKAARQALHDVPQLRSLIDQRLIGGIKLREDYQILNGDGSGQNLHGVAPQATAYSAPTGANAPENSADVLRLALLQVALSDYASSGMVLHPTDWTNIQTAKDSAGWYTAGGPFSPVGPVIWGLPVVATKSVAVGSFVTGAFDMAAQIFDVWDARIEVGYDGDDFTNNRITILGEERLALAVYRPNAFVKGSLSVS